jgi:hypothetical protein
MKPDVATKEDEATRDVKNISLKSEIRDPYFSKL